MPTFLELLESTPDPTAGRRPGDRNPQAFTEAARLVTRVLNGDRRAAIAFAEALTTSDFPALVGDIVNRATVANYAEYPSAILDITTQTRVRDFRQAERVSMDGAEEPFDVVRERAEYPETQVDQAIDRIAVAKFGKRFSLSFEMVVNDDLDQFRSAPSRLGVGARRTELRAVTDLYAGPSGPNAALYDGSNTLAGNPELTTDSLEAALTFMMSQVDDQGQPIWVDGAILVVGPALASRAERLLATTELRVTDGDGNLTILSGNGVSRNVRLIVDPYLPQVATTANAATSWFVFADPSTGRPALEFARLIGHEQPEIWVRTPDAMRVGGGTVGPESGSFETDAIDYRCRHIIGAARRTNTGGKRATVASNGTGA